MNRMDHKVRVIAGATQGLGAAIARRLAAAGAAGASDNERVLQAAESGDPDLMEKAASRLPFGRLIDPEEAARAVNFLVSNDAGLMTGAIVNFDQSVRGAVAGGMPAPDAPVKLVK
jgi:NAD(P)-dependent dehydrogenase (short-subunit alcohol dehydrogenase family)